MARSSYLEEAFDIWLEIGKAEGRILERFEYEARCDAFRRINAAVDAIQSSRKDGSSDTLEDIASDCNLTLEEVTDLANAYSKIED